LERITHELLNVGQKYLVAQPFRDASEQVSDHELKRTHNLLQNDAVSTAEVAMLVILK
jgi:hypothetical protein